RYYAIASCVLVVKMIVVANWAGFQRFRTGAWLNPEDARWVGKGKPAVAEEHPAVQRAQRAMRNDFENLIPFFVLGALYVATGASALGAAAYFGVFTVARVAHGVFYLNAVQPWRNFSYLAGLLVLIGLLTQILMRVL
ncbi:MAG: MAPEG family protein, partial [Myxococcales bacterium]|nr:MAPEG family protein [Myxococcales bacterium]